MMPRALVAVALGVLIAGAAPPSEGFIRQSGLSGQAAHLDAARGEDERRDHENLRGTPAYELKQYRRAPRCNVAGPVATTPLNGPCPPADGAVGVNNCGEDAPLDPLWMRERAQHTDAWPEGNWRLVDNGGCAADILPVMTEEDFRRLPLPAPVLTMQPDRGWVLINIETIVYTDPTPVTLRTDLLGIGVTVEATPTRWTYDFGDGHDLVTRNPGQPHPDHDVFHEYEAPGTTTITLTAEWTGRYQIDGSPAWRDINGTAITTAATDPFTIEERTSRLVSGLCTDRPKPPDC
ncbi:hypothetical protein [Cellulomonas sp. S1-8]|uniref:hypothetical protein n=1 Tax=Cellulomonas sp. S1-8 TaxID=2904790 RepID=UPI0022443812|nr:hypothetical protein [Cellulomonas sp. S1-8]UZN03072.1 PKD domain-containing protein [Cellulomonas sp. S1-8]